MNIMGRNKKNVLNQVAKEPQEKEISVKVTEETIDKLKEVHDLDAVEVAKEMASENFNVPKENVKVIISESEQAEISLKVSGEKLAEALEKNKRVDEELEEDVEEEVVEEVPRPAGIRSLDAETRNRLSRSELRFFQRTGILPK